MLTSSDLDRRQQPAGQRCLWDTLVEASRGGNTLHIPTDDASMPVTTLLERAERTCADLAALVPGAATPRRFGLLMANGEPWLRGFLAAVRCGAAAVPLPLPVSFAGSDAYMEHVVAILRDAEVSALLYDSSTARLVGHLASRRRVSTPLVDISTPPGPTARAPLPEPGRGEQEAVVQYTSGSTGRPKGVVLTNDNVLAGLSAIAGGLGLGPGDSMGSWLPLFHDMGLFGDLSVVALGGSLVLWQPGDFVRRPRRWLEAFAALRCTVCAAPNFAYELLARVAAEGLPASLDLSSWGTAINGAEPVHHGTIERFEEAYRPYGLPGTAMRPAYGLAEATLAVTFQQPGRTVGAVSVDRFHLSDGDEIRLVDASAPQARTFTSVGVTPGELTLRISPAGRPGAGGVVGEIQLTGAPVTAGYLGRPAAEQLFTEDGWLRTGDLGFLHAGELFVAGRLRDMIVLRGQNIYAEDVERLAATVTDGAAGVCVAFASQGDEPSETLVVLFEAEDPPAAGPHARALVRHIRLQLGVEPVVAVPVPKRWIPMTTSGKVRRRAARERYQRRLEAHGAGQAAVATGTEGSGR